MIKQAAGHQARPGVACILAVAILAILAIIMATVFAQGLRGRRMGDRRNEQLQTLWLARSGVEVAIARLLEEPLYTGGDIRPVPNSVITVKVHRHGDRYAVASEARYAVESSAPLVRRLKRHFLLSGAAGQRRLQAFSNEL
jgi:hypothetical protein